MLPWVEIRAQGPISGASLLLFERCDPNSRFISLCAQLQRLKLLALCSERLYGEFLNCPDRQLLAQPRALRLPFASLRFEQL